MPRLFERLSKPEPKQEPKPPVKAEIVGSIRVVYRDKPEVEALVKRVSSAKGSVSMTGADWELWTKYVQVI